MTLAEENKEARTDWQTRGKATGNGLLVFPRHLSTFTEQPPRCSSVLAGLPLPARFYPFHPLGCALGGSSIGLSKTIPGRETFC